MTSTDSPWAWVTQVYSLGFRFAFVEGRDAAEMIAACGVDPAAAQVLTEEEAVDEYADDPFFRTGETSGWGFLTEEVDGDGRDDLLCELSAGRRGVLVTWVSVEESMVLDYYEDGRCVRSLQPQAPDPDPGPEAVLVDPTPAQVIRSAGAHRDPVETARVSAALDLVTAEFGIRLTREQVVGPLLTGEVEIDMSWLDAPSGGAG
jgi:hypothetical protein